MGAVRRVVAISALLGVTTFAGVMLLGPVEIDPPGGRAAISSVSDQAARMRRAMAGGRTLAAANIAAQTIEHFPDDSEAWLWQVQVRWSAGDTLEAREAGRRLEEILRIEEIPAGQLAQSHRAYRLGWAYWVLSRQAEAEAHFRDAAVLYEPGSLGVVPEAYRQYNLACYWAMGGEIDRAANHFAAAVDAGFGGDAGWWRADPDLVPLREHRAYLDAAVVLQRREQDRANAAGGRGGAGGPRSVIRQPLSPGDEDDAGGAPEEDGSEDGSMSGFEDGSEADPSPEPVP